ncbi:hypothetical protein [Actinotalea sp. C106]|uniref:hypothetical protein n=1 Tax=Actinotalea sp. C106 TaxID=2908644 RepID=UPI002028852F|nr:hypothetical protein [Actinotalea sp. C106]
MSDTPRRFPISDTSWVLGRAMATRRGRPGKGERDLFVTRPAAVVGRAVRESAEREGYESLSEYIAAVLAEKEGLSEFAPTPHPAAEQGELPIKKGGARLKQSA